LFPALRSASWPRTVATASAVMWNAAPPMTATSAITSSRHPQQPVARKIERRSGMRGRPTAVEQPIGIGIGIA